MPKNHHFAFVTNQDDFNLIAEVLKKLNKESAIEINASHLIRISVRRFCQQIKSDEINSSTFFYNNDYKK